MSKPKAIYIIGGAGAGKSTFMRQVLDRIEAELKPLEDLHAKRNAKALVTLRGQAFESSVGPGMYLGLMRDQHPGTDGLDRASTPTAVEWLGLEEGNLPMIVAEGATLSTKAFFQPLSITHDLMVVHLKVDEMIRDLRFAQRGTTQKDAFVKSTETRSQNMANFALDLGSHVLTVDTEFPDGVSRAVTKCTNHLSGEPDDD